MKVIRNLFIIFSILFFFNNCTGAQYSINTSKVDTLMDVDLHGLKQKILIKSNDINNPVLLWLHGGPGTSEMFITHYCMDSLINYFTIVHWDQRGTALSYNNKIKSTEISFNKILEDAVVLTKILKSTFNQDKIFLFGHSFGSVLGIHLIERYPDDYYAYIGMGQVIDDAISREITYKWLLNKLSEDNDTTEILRIRENHIVPRELINKYKGIYYKGISLFDVIKGSPYYYEGYLDNYSKSTNFVRESMGKNPSTYEKNIFNDILILKIPVYFFEGRHDRIAACAPELVVEYYNKLVAPKKDIIWFEESAHHPNLDEPDKFQRMLIYKVLTENYKND